MEQPLTVARFIAERIEAVGKTQKQIAREAGFATPDTLSMIKAGDTRLPIGKVRAVARALETDPEHLLVLCLQEYQPEYWTAIEPLLDLAITADERRLLEAMRRWVGVPYLACMSEQSRQHLDALLGSMRATDACRTLQ